MFSAAPEPQKNFSWHGKRTQSSTARSAIVAFSGSHAPIGHFTGGEPIGQYDPTGHVVQALAAVLPVATVLGASMGHAEHDVERASVE